MPERQAGSNRPNAKLSKGVDQASLAQAGHPHVTRLPIGQALVLFVCLFSTWNITLYVAQRDLVYPSD